MDDGIVSVVLHENLDKGYQIRITANSFREVDYIHFKKYFLSYEGEWVPSKEGVSIPMSLQNMYLLLDTIHTVCSKHEKKNAIVEKLSKELNEQSN